MRCYVRTAAAQLRFLFPAFFSGKLQNNYNNYQSGRPPRHEASTYLPSQKVPLLKEKKKNEGKNGYFYVNGYNSIFYHFLVP